MALNPIKAIDLDSPKIIGKIVNKSKSLCLQNFENNG